MEKATVTYICKSCKGIFTLEKLFRNRLEAEMFEQKAAKKKRDCPSCYRKMLQEKAKTLADEFSLPEILGVSEKQIAYAFSIRERFVLQNEHMLRYAKTQLDRVVPENIPKVAEKWGVPEKECISEAFRSNDLEKAYLCLTKNQAREIIDGLLGNTP